MLRRSQATVGDMDVYPFFKRFSTTAEGVKPKKMFNYDETNLRDHPGIKTAIFKWGIKYAEKVGYHNVKSWISLVVCGLASGELLPPYVVYQAQNLYESWCQGGSVYSDTKSHKSVK